MKRRQKQPKKPRPKLRVTELGLDELETIVERAKAALSEDEHDKLKAAVETLAFLTRELEAKGASIERLRKLLFGASTEKTSRVLGDEPVGEGSGAAADEGPGATADEGGGNAAADGANGVESESEPKPKPPGHGRNGAAAYHGATKVAVLHQELHRGDACPSCPKGKVYPLSQPAKLVRVRGMAPLQATVYQCDRLRCNLCGEVFTAEAPDGVGTEKYDETAAGMIGLLRYGTGLPFNRIAKLERGFGIPLAPTTQWDVVERAARLLAPAHDELVRQAAQGEVLHNDDTTMRILELEREHEADDEQDTAEAGKERTGVYTSGIISVGQGHRIALFFTGPKHAGENLETVLARRARDLGPPIQMSDLLSHNTAGDFETIAAGCMAHSRRRYVDVVDNFPDECRHVLETLREVYKHDALTRERQLTDEERLRFHQEQSGPLMADLEKWLDAQIAEKRVEPNSGVGEAITFMRKHWKRLTLFLRVPGAPLDNNVVERALKKAICHRKNSLFYKTQNGAYVGDMFMSFIHTAELNDVDAFDYLVELQRHFEDVALNPSDWMPWNYRETLARLSSGPDPPV